MSQYRNSLKWKLIVRVGTVVAAVLVILAIIVFIKWRALIIQKQTATVTSITGAFSVFVINTLIYSESIYIEKEYLLDTYILDFMRDNKSVRYAVVQDSTGNTIAASDYNLTPGDGKNQNVPGARSPSVFFFKSPQHNWVIECRYPLHTGEKPWGTLTMGFDATETRREIATLFRAAVLLPVLITCMVLTMIYILIGGLTRSLTTLTQYVETTDPDSHHDINLETDNDEVGILADAFNRFQRRLATSRGALIQAQRQVFHAEKLASIGRLASGVAHEINNPLNGIKNCLYVIRQDGTDCEESNKYLDLISEGLQHIELVVQKLLGFSRKESTERCPINLNENLAKALELIEYRLSRQNIRLEQELDPDLPSIMGIPLQLQEVFMNLLLNSFDAVPDDGVIRIQTHTSGDNAVVTISDNGPGIPEDVRDTIFEPFFTTKDPGIGTGLGLSVAMDIVNAHQGTIQVESEADGGSTFILTFPGIVS